MREDPKVSSLSFLPPPRDLRQKVVNTLNKNVAGLINHDLLYSSSGSTYAWRHGSDMMQLSNVKNILDRLPSRKFELAI